MEYWHNYPAEHTVNLIKFYWFLFFFLHKKYISLFSTLILIYIHISIWKLLDYDWLRDVICIYIYWCMFLLFFFPSFTTTLYLYALAMYWNYVLHLYVYIFIYFYIYNQNHVGSRFVDANKRKLKRWLTFQHKQLCIFGELHSLLYVCCALCIRIRIYACEWMWVEFVRLCLYVYMLSILCILVYLCARKLQYRCNSIRRCVPFSFRLRAFVWVCFCVRCATAQLHMYIIVLYTIHVIIVVEASWHGVPYTYI